MANKTVIIDGVEVPVLPAKAEEIIKNKVTGQTYATIDEFNADVANPSTPTKAFTKRFKNNSCIFRSSW
jgi:hypothetical protein